jgi:hypothetical protein
MLVQEISFPGLWKGKKNTKNIGEGSGYRAFWIWGLVLRLVTPPDEGLEIEKALYPEPSPT